MGKLQVFEVIFDGDGGDLFRAGDWVQGHVRIVLSQAKNDIRGIQITFVGKSMTRWTESEGSGDHKSTVTYFLKEKYFQEKILILGKTKQDCNGEKVQLGMGEHRFPFRFQIPTGIPLPQPLEGRYGYVRYKVKANIDRPWRFDHKTQRLFSVVGAPVDLNMIPQAQMPSKNEDMKNVCCLCCAQPVMCSAQTDKGGYVPGETIWVSGMIDNKTSRNIVDVTAKLKQDVIFRAKRCGTGREHTRREKNVLCEVKGQGCGDYQMAYFDRKPLVIPSCPPSFLAGCDIINIEYYVEFSADITSTPFDADVKLPITIGSIPLANTYAAVYPPGHVITQQPSAPPDAPPPPSYEVAMGGPQEIPTESGHDYTFGKLMYAPRYPYYNFPSPGDPSAPPPPSIYPSGEGGQAPPY